MLKVDLENLERALDKLIMLANQKKLENVALGKKLESLHQENSILVAKKKTAVAAIKIMIRQLEDELNTTK